MAVHVGQPEIPASISIREALVVKTEQVQDRGMQIVHMHTILDGSETEFVCRPMHVAAASAARLWAFDQIRHPK
jgi:hypothetical protein